MNFVDQALSSFPPCPPFIVSHPFLAMPPTGISELVPQSSMPNFHVDRSHHTSLPLWIAVIKLGVLTCLEVSPHAGYCWTSRHTGTPTGAAPRDAIIVLSYTSVSSDETLDNYKSASPSTDRPAGLARPHLLRLPPVNGLIVA